MAHQHIAVGFTSDEPKHMPQTSLEMLTSLAADPMHSVDRCSRTRSGRLVKPVKRLGFD